MSFFISVSCLTIYQIAWKTQQFLNNTTYSPVYATVILGTARLNFGTRAHFLGTALSIFVVYAKLKVRVPKLLGGPRPPQEVLLAHLYKHGSADRKLVSHAFCFSHCKYVVSVQTKYRGKMWSDEVVQKLRYI